MKTSLNDIKNTEQYLLGGLPPEESLVFEARRLTNRELRLNVHIQEKLMMLLKYFYRKQLKNKVKAAGASLFNDPGKHEFREKISKIFKQ